MATGIDKPDSMKSARIDGVVERALEPAIARRLQGNAQRLAYEQAVLDTNIWAISVGEYSSGTRSNSSPRPGERLTLSFRPMDGVSAFASAHSSGRQIWIADSDGSKQIQLTSFTSSNFGFANAPRWSPDGRQIAFMAMIDGYWDIYLIPAEGGHPASEMEPSLGRAAQLVARRALDLLTLDPYG